MHFRTTLQRVLHEEGRKQSWLATKIGKDPADVSRIVNGMHADEATRQAIADQLCRQVEDLWPEEDLAA